MKIPEQEKDRIIQRLITILADVHALVDPVQLAKAIFMREELTSTCIGNGCAVPHAHSPALDTTYFAAARLKPPRDFNAPDGEPVSLVFLMAGPDSNSGLHIKLLSKLVRLLHDTAFREELCTVKTAEDFYQLICRKDV